MADTVDGATVICVAEITTKDIQAFGRYYMRREGLPLYALAFGAALLVGTGLLIAIYSDEAVVAALVIAGLAVVGVRNILAQKNLQRAYVGQQRVVAWTEAVVVERQDATFSYGWRALHGLGETDDHYFVMTSPMIAFILPKRGFGSETDVHRFRSLAMHRLGR
jgi:hypothetical protein